MLSASRGVAAKDSVPMAAMRIDRRLYIRASPDVVCQLWSGEPCKRCITCRAGDEGRCRRLQLRLWQDNSGAASEGASSVGSALKRSLDEEPDAPAVAGKLKLAVIPAPGAILPNLAGSAGDETPPSASALTRGFTRWVGASPSQWRKANKLLARPKCCREQSATQMKTAEQRRHYEMRLGWLKALFLDEARHNVRSSRKSPQSHLSRSPS